MSVILEPNLTIDDIVFEMDENNEYGANRFLGGIGGNIPIIKIGDYVLSLGDLQAFNLKLLLNSVPIFRMTINDEQYIVREKLKANIDKCIIFFGYKDWYIKFNGLLNTTFSEVGDYQIEVEGCFYNEKLYDSFQKSYKDKTISDILKDICSSTSMGLFTIDNSDLSKQIDYSLNPGNKYIDYFDFIIKNYTTNIYSIDTYGYFHVCDIDKLKDQSLDKYTIDWKNGTPLSDGEQDIIFKSLNKDGDSEKNDFTIPIEYYCINTNFSKVHKNTCNKYYLGIGGEGNTELISKDILGIGNNKTNTFSGFKNHKNPFYDEIINKKLAGNIIKIKPVNLFMEILLFSIVQFDCYLPQTNGREIKLDDEHSGKKIVVSIEYDFERKDNEKNRIEQIIELI
jgi:hypothetical protein